MLSPVDKREEAANAQKQFYSHQSDHLAVCNAYNKWMELKNTTAQWSFCEKNYLSMNTFKSMVELRRQFNDMLIELGYVSKSNWEHNNINSNNEKIVKAVILAGLYPNVAGVRLPQRQYNQTGEGALAVTIKSSEITYYAENCNFTVKLARVFIHPSSNLFKEDKYQEDAVIVYGSQVATTKVFIRECSVVSAVGLLLLGGKYQILYGGNAVSINGIRFRTSERVSALISGMRRLLDLTLDAKFTDPAIDVTENEMGKLCIDLLGSTVH
jgi:HrpA-like RNA helicase